MIWHRIRKRNEPATDASKELAKAAIKKCSFLKKKEHFLNLISEDVFIIIKNNVQYKQKEEITMFSKNLKYYRLKNALSKKELADRIHVSPMAITNYENGNRKPNMDILKKMAKVLGVRVSDFLAVRNSNLTFVHGEFRKNSTLTVAQQDYIREYVEEYLNRFMTVVEVLGGDVLPDAPKTNFLPLNDNDEINARSLREHMNIATDGPVENLIGILENKGILVFFSDGSNDKFSGMNGFVNGRPYIIVNPNMTTERNRSTIVHELAHLMFLWPDSMDGKEVENRATSISGAFLFPKIDVIRELGVHRNVIAKDMLLTAKEYGISMMLLVTRAKAANVISDNVARDFYIQASEHGWRKNEPTRIEAETPSLFEQLVFRAVNEGDISLQKGAEFLKMPYDDISAQCCFNEEL
jgi:Zn-dependent peptidase ImmA (M78 family)/DNA-binding XRE family transcriptional regulator